MIYRCMDIIFDMSRLVAVTELNESVAWRKFAIFIGNGNQCHKFEGRMNTAEGVKVSRAHREVMEWWRFWERDALTFHLRANNDVLYRLRNFNISLASLTALEWLDGDETTPPSFNTYFMGLDKPITVAASARDEVRVGQLRDEFDNLSKAWEAIIPGLTTRRAHTGG